MEEKIETVKDPWSPHIKFPSKIEEDFFSYWIEEKTTSLSQKSQKPKEKPKQVDVIHVEVIKEPSIEKPLPLTLEWYMYRGNPQLTGYLPEEKSFNISFEGEISCQWTKPFEKPILSPLIASSGKVIVCTTDNKITILDGSTGHSTATYSLPESEKIQPFAPCIVKDSDGDKLYLAADKSIHIFSFPELQKIKSIKLDEGELINTHPIVIKSFVILGIYNKNENRSKIFSIHTKRLDCSEIKIEKQNITQIVSDGELVIGGGKGSGNLIVLQIKNDGLTKHWEGSLPDNHILTSISPSLAVSKGRLFLFTNNGELHEVRNLGSSKPRFDYTGAKISNINSFILSDTDIIVGTGIGGKKIDLDLHTEKEFLKGESIQVLMGTSNMIVVMEQETSDIFACSYNNPTIDKIKHRFSSQEKPHSCVVSNKRIFLSANFIGEGGKVYCLSIEE